MIRYIPLLLLTAATPALAQSITIENFIGTVELRTGDTLKVAGSDTAKFDLRKTSLTIDYDQTFRSVSCSTRNGRTTIKTGGMLGKSRKLEDYPSLTITAPESTALVIRDSIVFGTFDDLGDVDVSLPSCGKADFADVSGGFMVKLSGSADVTAGDVGEAELRTSGSGDFKIGSAQSLSFSSSGAGDLEARDVAGPADVRSTGSGDAVLARVGDGLDFRTTGSGDLLVGRVDGDVSVTSTGSGDAEIDAGEITGLDVRTTGSGDVVIGGSVGAVDVVSTGSGGVTLASQSGPLSHRSTGSGKLKIGGDEMRRR